MSRKIVPSKQLKKINTLANYLIINKNKIMNYKKTSIIVAAITAMIITSCNNSDDATPETENLEAVTAMTESTNKMVAANAVLTTHHSGPLYHHNDSIYHHHDSIYIHHHTIYHHGDTIHHHSDGQHNEIHHHQHDSIVVSHHNIAH